jgi:hypothetical protein
MMVEEEKDVRESAMAICVSYCGRVFYFPVCVLVPLCEAVKICFAAPLEVHWIHIGYLQRCSSVERVQSTWLS